MAVQSMNLLNVTFKKENVFDILLRVNNATCFYPQKASMFIHSQKNVKVLETDSSYDNLYHRLQQTSFRLGFELEDIHFIIMNNWILKKQINILMKLRKN